MFASRLQAGRNTKESRLGATKAYRPMRACWTWRGTFHSVQPRPSIPDYIRENNKNGRPLQWVASGNTIVRKVRKYKWTLETGD